MTYPKAHIMEIARDLNKVEAILEQRDILLKQLEHEHKEEKKKIIDFFIWRRDYTDSLDNDVVERFCIDLKDLDDYMESRE